MTSRKPVVLLIGSGSISSRHEIILKNLGCDVFVVSRRGKGNYTSISDALKNNLYSIAVIATETARHLHDLNELIINGFEGLIVIEKPLFNNVVPVNQENIRNNIIVAYNLRFHPVVNTLMRYLEKSTDRIIAAQLYAGQHLSLWRKGRCVKEVYSSSVKNGGGVLRDLSHELDLALYLFGPVSYVKALGGRCSEITVDSDDAWSIVSRHEKCPQITINLNYFDRPSRRFIHINTENETLTADLVDNTLVINGSMTSYDKDSNNSYISMWKNIKACLEGEWNGTLCTYKQGMDVMKYIQACENSAATDG